MRPENDVVEYVIHRKVAVKVETTVGAYQRYFANEYARVSVPTPLDADGVVINVRVVRRLPKHRLGDRRRSIRFKRLFHYQYVVRNLEARNVEVFFRDLTLGRVYPNVVTLFLQAQVLEPIIYFKMLEHGVLFMHAAGVSDGDRAYLFPACGGTGKTTLTLGLMGEGMQVLGDDLLIVEPRRQVAYPYLRPLHLFTYNVRTLRNARLPLRLRAAVRGKDILRKVLESITRQEFLISTRVHADAIYPDFKPASPAKYFGIYFLKKSGNHERVEVRHDTLRDLARAIAESADLNVSLRENVLDTSEHDALLEREIAVIERVIQGVQAVNFVNSRLLDFRDLKEFRTALANGGLPS